MSRYLLGKGFRVQATHTDWTASQLLSHWILPRGKWLDLGRSTQTLVQPSPLVCQQSQSGSDGRKVIRNRPPISASYQAATFQIHAASSKGQANGLGLDGWTGKKSNNSWIHKRQCIFVMSRRTTNKHRNIVSSSRAQQNTTPAGHVKTSSRPFSTTGYGRRCPQTIARISSRNPTPSLFSCGLIILKFSFILISSR